MDLIDKFTKEGILLKIEAGTLPHVYVGRPFYRLTFEDKTTIIKVVSAYYYVLNGQKLVVLNDGYSGKKIGQFSEFGLKLSQ